MTLREHADKHNLFCSAAGWPCSGADVVDRMNMTGPNEVTAPTLIPTVWTPEAEVAAYEALAGVPWAEWGRSLLHGREFDDYGPGLYRVEGAT